MNLIKGAFKTSDWPTMIDRVKEESEKQNIVAKKWELERIHDITEQQINEKIESTVLDKNEGILIQGQILAYDVFTPTVEKIEQVPFDYKDYTDMDCALFEIDNETKKVRVIINQRFETCKDWAGFNLTRFIQNRYKTLYISGKDGNYKVFNVESQVKEEPQVKEQERILVLPVHKYSWAVNV